GKCEGKMGQVRQVQPPDHNGDHGRLEILSGGRLPPEVSRQESGWLHLPHFARLNRFSTNVPTELRPSDPRWRNEVVVTLGFICRNPVGFENVFGRLTQGSSCLATLG